MSADHTSELALTLSAPTFHGLLIAAGHGLAEILLRGLAAEPLNAERAVTVTGRDREALLVNWLNELLFLAETERAVPAAFEVSVNDGTISATVRSVPVDEAPAMVKAATHHGLEISEHGGELHAEVILDI